jgi:hypothetical protein
MFPSEPEGLSWPAIGDDNLNGMDTKPFIADLDAQIAKLEQAKAVLLSLDTALVRQRLGRPKGSGIKKATMKRSRLSAEARANIAAAQKKRWAAVKKAKVSEL